MAVIHRYWSENSVEVFCEMSSGIVIRQQMTWWDDPDRKVTGTCRLGRCQNCPKPVAGGSGGD